MWRSCPAAGSSPGPLRPGAVRTRRVPRGCTGRQLRRISPSSSSELIPSLDSRRISVSPNDRRRRNLLSYKHKRQHSCLSRMHHHVAYIILRLCLGHYVSLFLCFTPGLKLNSFTNYTRVLLYVSRTVAR